MKEIFYNTDNLTSSDIDETVTRVKAIIINENQELLLGYCDKTYQFPGGHIEENEDNETGLVRELLEETGIELTKEEIPNPSMLNRYYSKNYRHTGKNRENVIYYYLIKTNKLPDINKTHLDDEEIKGNYTLKYIKLNDLSEELQRTINDNIVNEVIYHEILSCIKELNLV